MYYMNEVASDQNKLIQKRTITPGRPFSPEAPASPCRQTQRGGKNELTQTKKVLDHDVIPVVLPAILPWGQQVQHLP